MGDSRAVGIAARTAPLQNLDEAFRFRAAPSPVEDLLDIIFMASPLASVRAAILHAQASGALQPHRLRALALGKARYLILLVTFAALLLIWSQHGVSGSWRSDGAADLLEEINESVPASLAGDLQYLSTALLEHFSTHGQSVPHPVFHRPTLTSSQRNRYQHLRARLDSSSDKILLTTITRQIQDQLPDLLTALVVLIDFLGATKLSFSFIEGPSSDLTSSTFESVLHPLLISLGVPARQIKFVTSAPKIDFDKGNRIELLAELRNQALAPLWEDRARKSGGIGEGVKQVVFFNDVYMKAEHVLELLHQHVVNGADVTTAWDWFRREPAYYYDVWVGRTIDTGDIFYPIPHEWWSPSDDLFPDSPASKSAFDALAPFQAFASWNGIAVLQAAPFLPPHDVRFRRSNTTLNECASSECLLVCSDFWRNGFGKVQIVPSVQVAYERDVAVQTEMDMQRSRKSLGWVDGVPPLKKAQSQEQALSWRKRPPAKIRCNAWPETNGLSANVWQHTTWVPTWISNDGDQR